MAAAPKQEQQAYQQAQPVFAAYCSKCHTSGGGKDNRTALSHFNMDSYPFAGHHAAEITAAIRKVLGTAGSSPTMPKDMPGAVKGDDLGRILAWAEAYDRSHRSGASTSHEHHGYEHTGEDEHAGHHH
jgi:mono/diheme cytochrome c family protein